MSPVPGGRSTRRKSGFVPENVGQELLQRFVQHGTTPDDRLVLLDEKAHRDTTNSVCFRRHDHLVDHHRLTIDTQHAGDRESPDIGIDNGNGTAPIGQRHRQVRGDRTLSNAALARCDQKDARAVVGIGKRNRRLFGLSVLMSAGSTIRALQLLAQGLSLLVGHHTEFDDNVGHAAKADDGLPYSAINLGPERTASYGQIDGNGNVRLTFRTGDINRANHVELDDAAVQLWIFDWTQCFQNLIVANRHGHSSWSQWRLVPAGESEARAAWLRSVDLTSYSLTARILFLL